MENSPGEYHAMKGFEVSHPLRSFAKVTYEVLVRPSAFFSALAGPFSRGEVKVSGAVFFTVICAYIATLMAFFLAPGTVAFGSVFLEGAVLNLQTFFGVSVEGSVVEFGLRLLFAAVAIFLLTTLRLFMETLVQYGLVLLLIRNSRGLDGTLLVNGYSNALILLTWIPYAGTFISLYFIYIRTAGLKQIHNTTTNKAFAAAIIPPTFSFILHIMSYVRQIV